MEQVLNKEQDRLMCKKHKMAVSALVLDQPNLFMCNNCLIEAQAYNNAIFLEDLSKSEDILLKNWPLKKDYTKTLNKNFNQLLSRQDIYDERMKEIQTFYDEIRQQINEFIENEKKTCLKILSAYSDEEQCLSDQLYEFSLLDKLKDLIKELNNQNMQGIKEKIIQLMNESENSLKENQAEIDNSISSYNLVGEQYSKIQGIINEVSLYKTQLRESEEDLQIISIQMLEKYAFSKIRESKRDNIYKTYNSLKYNFIKSEYDSSNQIVIDNNTFINKPGLCQSIQSEQAFSNGVHSFVFTIESLPEKYGHFYIALANNSIGMYEPIWDCLCCGDGHFTGEAFRDRNQSLQSGSIFKVLLDFDNDSVAITELVTGRQRKCISESVVNYQNLRFALCWGYSGVNPEQLPIKIIYTD